jgi:hypothetical protein
VPSLKVVLVAAAMTFLVAAGASCKRKASAAQCEELLDRYAQLAVKERAGDAGADVAAEKQEARGHDAFKNCQSEVQLDEHACAMKATTSAAMLKCLD